eukprot:gene5153-5393_t
MFYAVVDQHLTVLVPALTDNINAMKDAAAFGQTLKQGQLKELREFSDAILAITLELRGEPRNSSSGSSSSINGSLSGVRPSASGKKPVLPEGISTINPDSFFYVKEKLVSALSKLHAAFKGSHPQLAKALSQAKNEIEDTGLFEDM